jgi:hypothetical protein
MQEKAVCLSFQESNGGSEVRVMARKSVSSEIIADSI